MRIVAGAFRGREIRTPEGQETRPTSERAREAVFNILAHADWAPPLPGARVIDLFAGSGALGLEALSRGAAFCLFVETSATARGCIRANIEAFGLFGATRIHRRSATDLGEKPAGVGPPFTLAFLDPPYRTNLAASALDQVTRGDWLSPDAVAVVETSSAEPGPAPPGWSVEMERAYGATRVTFLKRLAG